MDTNTSLAAIYGWSRRGERARLKVPRNWGVNITLLASTTREVFGAYMEHVLASSSGWGRWW